MILPPAPPDGGVIVMLLLLLRLRELLAVADPAPAKVIPLKPHQSQVHVLEDDSVATPFVGLSLTNKVAAEELPAMFVSAVATNVTPEGSVIRLPAETVKVPIVAAPLTTNADAPEETETVP